ARFLPARLTAIGGGSEGNPGAAVVATLRSRAIPKGCHIHGECSRSARIEFQQPAVERHLELPAAYASHKAVERGGVVRWGNIAERHGGGRMETHHPYLAV